MPRFRGVMPYLVTPIDQNGRIKEDVLKSLCVDLIEKGVHGLTPLGSTGEFAYLNSQQRKTAVAVSVDAAEGRVPVIAGVASTSIADAIDQVKCYANIGANGILAVLESYFPLTQSEVEKYFLKIADATDLPIIIYTNPNFQRTDLSIDTIVNISRHPNIVGLKDASSNTGRLLSIIDRCGDQLDVFSASSHIPTCAMMIGGKGWFAGPACVIPRESVRLYELCIEGNWQAAMSMQKHLWRFNELFARYNLAACVKAALEQQGYNVGHPVPPQSPLGPEAREQISSFLAKLQSESILKT